MTQVTWLIINFPIWLCPVFFSSPLLFPSDQWPGFQRRVQAHRCSWPGLHTVSVHCQLCILNTVTLNQEKQIKNCTWTKYNYKKISCWVPILPALPTPGGDFCQNVQLLFVYLMKSLEIKDQNVFDISVFMSCIHHWWSKFLAHIY